MAQAGLTVPADYERLADAGAAGGAGAARALIDLADPPTAVIAASISQALGIVNAARSVGVRVPQDTSVVGYNDNELATEFGLTTMQVPLRVLGSIAVELLLLLLADPSLPAQVRRVSAELVVPGRVRRRASPSTNAVRVSWGWVGR